MKNQLGIWIDTSKAIIVMLKDEKEQVKEIISDIENRVHHGIEGDKGSYAGSTHINHEKKFDERKKNQINDFMNTVFEEIKHSDEIYVFGPAEIKLKLKQRIESDEKVSSKLKSVETADSMTLNQVVAQVKEFYSK
jgi:hypothetical protein